MKKEHISDALNMRENDRKILSVMFQRIHIHCVLPHLKS